MEPIIIDVENLENRIAAGETVEFRPGFQIKKADGKIGYIVSNNTGINRYYLYIENALVLKYFKKFS